MTMAVKKQAETASQADERAAVRPPKQAKLPALLVTGDDALWPQIGVDLHKDLILRQLDSIDELIASTPAGQGAIVLWDARGHIEPAAVLSRLSIHSSCYAIVALDTLASAGAWTMPIQHRQVVAHVGIPIVGEVLARALENAHEEVNARIALLGEPRTAAALPENPKKSPALAITLGALVAVACAGAYLLTHRSSAPTPAATPAAPKAASSAAAPKAALETDEKVDQLIEHAQQAMQERHFIDPAAGSALALYREVLIVDPNNGEARQGLQRLEEILISRVQSALDERHFDVALQSLETARSIDASDRRLTALDEKIASLRAELGPAQIMAAINAQNFDRATQLIDDAARAKSLSAPKLAQMRDEVRRRRDESDSARWFKLIDARLQQDRLVEPRNDSAAYYLEQARQAGIPNSALQVQMQDLFKRMASATRSATEQHRLAEAEHMIAEMHTAGAPASLTSALQRELGAARGLPAAGKPEQPQYLELAQSRLAQGRLTDPESDSALFYVNQLRAQDSKNAALPQISAALQAQILERARAAIDSGDSERADSLLQRAGTLGPSSELDGIAKRLHPSVAASNEPPSVAEQSLTRVRKLEVLYPQRAMQNGVEGWVELGFTVNPDGTTANVVVLNANPTTTFDAAASKAVRGLRYQPVIQGGKAVAVTTQLRVVFRIPK
jgi:TonB family protein